MNQNNKLIPVRIKEIRESQGLSQADFSKIIGITPQAVSQYENGRTSPSIFVLRKISNQFNIPISFFYMPNINTSMSNSPVFYRANKSSSIKDKISCQPLSKWLYETVKYFENYVDFTAINLPPLDDFILDGDKRYSKLDIETITTITRDYWNIGDSPINNMVSLLEDNGFIISRLNKKISKIDAFSQWYNGKAFMFFGSNRESSVSLRFSLAHELGHIILHQNLIDDTFKNKIIPKLLNDKLEEEANYFASVFLFPSSIFSKELINNSLDYFIILKKRWKISISAMIKKCEDLDMLSDNQINYLKRQMSFKKYWQKEPLDDIIPIENPTIFMETMNLLIENKLETKSSILENLSLPENIIISLFSLEDDFFSAPANTHKKPHLKLVKK